MSMRTILPAPVRRSFTVRASPERAFEVFTAGIGRWWPKTHKIGAAPLERAVIEPFAGGRWFEIGEDGSECDWGRVIAFEPPARLLLAWQLGADYRFDPALVTEVEVRFSPAGPGETRVDFEHRHLERIGDAAESMRAAFESPNGWGRLLELFAAEAAKDPQEDGA